MQYNLIGRLKSNVSCLFNIGDRIWQRAGFVFECDMFLQLFLDVQGTEKKGNFQFSTESG